MNSCLESYNEPWNANYTKTNDLRTSNWSEPWRGT